MKAKIGQVTNEERDQIKAIFERKNGLEELFKTLKSPNDILYERLITDMGSTTTMFQMWWDNMANKYAWKPLDGGRWEIEFESCDIYLTID